MSDSGSKPVSAWIGEFVLLASLWGALFLPPYSGGPSKKMPRRPCLVR